MSAGGVLVLLVMALGAGIYIRVRHSRRGHLPQNRIRVMRLRVRRAYGPVAGTPPSPSSGCAGAGSPRSASRPGRAGR